MSTRVEASMTGATRVKGILDVSGANDFLLNDRHALGAMLPRRGRILSYSSFSARRRSVQRSSLAKTHRLYGLGLSDSPTAASFVRPSRPSDKPLGFLDALRKKYVSNEISGTALLEDQIKISGKTVEEVGFEKIQEQLAILQELRFVILDGLCIAGIEGLPGQKMSKEWLQIKNQALSIIELDLSRNLLEEWSDVVGICCALRSDFLRSLKLEYVR